MHDVSIVAVNALYPAARRGLTADVIAAHTRGLKALPVCTALAMAAGELVTDFVEVPEDTVRSQLDHIDRAIAPAGARIGVLAQHGTARTVLEWAERLQGPVVLDLQISGPAGETVLSRRGLEEVTDRIGAPDVVLIDRTDAELVSGGEIQSLDDAQVAVQRIARRGARAVVLKAGVLPARHFEADSAGDATSPPFSADVLYDGSEFTLFEAPYMEDAPRGGASSVHSVALLHALIGGSALEEAVREAKSTVTDALRSAREIGSERLPG